MQPGEQSGLLLVHAGGVGEDLFVPHLDNLKHDLGVRVGHDAVAEGGSRLVAQEHAGTVGADLRDHVLQLADGPVAALRVSRTKQHVGLIDEQQVLELAVQRGVELGVQADRNQQQRHQQSFLLRRGDGIKLEHHRAFQQLVDGDRRGGVVDVRVLFDQRAQTQHARSGDVAAGLALIVHRRDVILEFENHLVESEPGHVGVLAGATTLPSVLGVGLVHHLLEDCRKRVGHRERSLECVHQAGHVAFHRHTHRRHEGVDDERRDAVHTRGEDGQIGYRVGQAAVFSFGRLDGKERDATFRQPQQHGVDEVRFSGAGLAHDHTVLGEVVQRDSGLHLPALAGFHVGRVDDAPDAEAAPVQHLRVEPFLRRAAASDLQTDGGAVVEGRTHQRVGHRERHQLAASDQRARHLGLIPEGQVAFAHNQHVTDGPRLGEERLVQRGHTVFDGDRRQHVRVSARRGEQRHQSSIQRLCVLWGAVDDGHRVERELVAVVDEIKIGARGFDECRRCHAVRSHHDLFAHHIHHHAAIFDGFPFSRRVQRGNQLQRIRGAGTACQLVGQRTRIELHINRDRLVVIQQASHRTAEDLLLAANRDDRVMAHLLQCLVEIVGQADIATVNQHAGVAEARQPRRHIPHDLGHVRGHTRRVGTELPQNDEHAGLRLIQLVAHRNRQHQQLQGERAVAEALGAFRQHRVEPVVEPLPVDGTGVPGVDVGHGSYLDDTCHNCSAVTQRRFESHGRRPQNNRIDAQQSCVESGIRISPDCTSLRKRIAVPSQMTLQLDFGSSCSSIGTMACAVDTPS